MGEKHTEFRWLIEAPGLRYLSVHVLGGDHFFKWTEDHNAALAFRSEEQADAAMMAVRSLSRRVAPSSDRDLFGFETSLGNAKAVEHGFIDGTSHA